VRISWEHGKGNEMKINLLAVFMLLSLASVFAQERSAPTYQDGKVVESPAHSVYIIETSTIRFKIVGSPTLVINEVVHFRIDTSHKPFIILKDGKEYKYFLNEQEPVHHLER
jgi:hypothetical protein